ncbi:MAG: RsmB/NOP family class I SAM-dependent RNA methyltransferase [Candidatus Woesearchaeota archaeon]
MLEPFHNKEKIIVKPKFEKRYRELLGDSYEKFLEYSLAFNRRGIRVNTLKISVQKLVSRLGDWKLTPVPWSLEHFWIEHDSRRDVGNLLEHAQGYIYVQDPASAIPPLVLQPTSEDRVLDMCAAPGSKTTQMAQMMQNEGLIIANEYVGSRIAALGINVQRMGCKNVLISHNDANRLNRSLFFTKILVDAPCSGTGTIRKSPKTLMMWNPGMIVRLARTQLRILEKAYRHLEPGGVIVYSTCTLEPQENEGVISQFLQKYEDMDVAPIDLQIKRSEPITEFEGEVYDSRVSQCLRIWPQDNNTEGFFVCKLVKRT